MTIDEWLEKIPDDERETLCFADGWRAGASAMLDALIDRGFITGPYEQDARRETMDISGEG